jgi:predicted PurR-regulated permease PerM
MIVIASSRRERTSRAHFFAFLLALATLSGVFLWMTAPFVLSLFLGGLLALVAWPAYEWLRARRVGRRTAAGLCTLLMLVLVVGPFAAFIFLAARQGAVVGRQLAELKISPDALTRMLDRTPLAGALGEPAAVNARVMAAVQAGGLRFSAAVLAVAKGVPQLLLNLVLGLIAFYFFLIDGRRFVDFMLSRAVFERDVQDRLRGTFADMARATVLSGCAAAATQAAGICAAYLIFGVPGAFVAGAGTFFLAWIPMIGSVPAAAAGAAWLYSQGEPGRMAAMLALCALVSVLEHIVRPLVLKGRSGLHPMVGLVAIFAAIDMCGVLGIFVGPLLAAVVISLLELWPEIAGRFGVEVPRVPETLTSGS